MPPFLRDYEIRKAFPGTTRQEILDTPAAEWDWLLGIENAFNRAKSSALSGLPTTVGL